MWHHARFWVGELAGERLVAAQEHDGHRAVRELLCVLCCCFCMFFLSVLLLLLFTSFAVLLNCPHPDPRVLPFYSHSPPHPSGGRGNRATAWPLVAGRGWTMTNDSSHRIFCATFFCLLSKSYFPNSSVLLFHQTVCFFDSFSSLHTEEQHLYFYIIMTKDLTSLKKNGMI